MNSDYLKKALLENDIKSIKSKINILEKENHVINPIIKDDMFKLLESVGKVLYYPIKDNVCAFYINIDNNHFKENIIFINTCMPYEKQIFAAAHEFAHIIGIAGDQEELLAEDKIFNYIFDSIEYTNKNEVLANYFASELLVKDTILESQLLKMKVTKLDSITVEDIIRLMDIFLFPYKPMVLKLYCIGKISYEKYKELINISCNNSIFQLQNRLGLCSRNNEMTRIKSFSNFIDLAINSYEMTVRTYDKLKYVLKLFDLTPEKLGVKKKSPKYLSEDELEEEIPYDL
ncbi:ImmA/IrrE family metallo-endopeptidase [Clostridium sp. WILCCON 0269]|uniref:ImmA/IrrE family metallo-endopeptidase n=1 Tax=Candidatus Clostridium eludens TaxID=3381663 RepID=A0ABW8SH56_9CLOT